VNGTFHQGERQEKRSKAYLVEERINRQDFDLGEAEGKALDFKIGQ
jgi:hypothetical protein